MPTPPPPIAGLHHITAIAKDPRQNVAFYTSVLGMRLVKQTVNFDDPSTYHLYFADNAGTPGSVLTFFPWPNVAKGELGAGETSATMFAITPASLPFWLSRFRSLHIAHDAPQTRLDETFIAFRDHDGMRLELVARDEHASIAFAPVLAETNASINPASNPVPIEHQLRGFAGASLLLRSASKTIDLLTTTMGYRVHSTHHNTTRLLAQGTLDATPTPHAIMARTIDVHEDPFASRGRTGSGTVHHIAFRTASDHEQTQWQAALAARGLNTTEILDRSYFHSIYVREPGGVLFEFATNTPGFAIDEPLTKLGEQLRLPAPYEPMRAILEQRLPKLR